MRLLKLALRPHTAVPVLAVSFATVVCTFLVLGRIAWSGNFRYGALVWNLFLAWVPLAFSLLALEKYDNPATPKWQSALLAGGWLLFFPNSPYIFTDLIHLTTFYFGHFWMDLGLVLSCALAGLIAGFISLYLMQAAVMQIAGRLVSWLFVFSSIALSAFGIYLGRFLRFNSWDIFIQPGGVYRGLAMASPFNSKFNLGFQLLFGSFILIAYIMLYGLTHLRQAPNTPQRESQSLV
jgi:uncharacterized membrane protein